MSPRPRATFAKRQKEQARQEKQRAKAQRKLERKLENKPALDGVTSAQDENERLPALDQPVSESQMDSQ